MKKIALFLTLALLACVAAPAQPPKGGGTKAVRTQAGDVVLANHEYSVVVYERDQDSAITFDHEIAQSGSRSFFNDLFNIYRSTFIGKVGGTTAGILGAGIDWVVGLLNRKAVNQGKWHAAMQKELTFTKQLPMQTDIADFYRLPSTLGAMDPQNMIFNGFGCRQYLTYKDGGETKRILVFEVACSLNDSPAGKQRIANHGKFEIKVDSIRFNPFLCDLPNDSLTAEQVEESLRIPFDFERRQNLKFQLRATITSSWMNEAIQIYNDQQLGEFLIEFTIPGEDALEKSGPWQGYFVYDASRLPPGAPCPVTVKGDCFVVPRSFIRTLPGEDGAGTVSEWGTGQYRVDMTFTESCQLNEKYYYITRAGKDGKPRRQLNDCWKDEWKLIKRRQPAQNLWGSIVNVVRKQFDVDRHQWVHTLLDPVQQVVVVDQTRWLNQIIKEKPSSEAAAAQQSQGKAQGQGPNQNSKPAGM